jgi:hypothetical protein
MSQRTALTSPLTLKTFLIAALALCSVASPGSAQTPDPTADQIIEQAVERARLQREAEADIGFESTVEAITEHLDGDGEVEKTERATYRQYAVEGVLYEELVAREGAALSNDDIRNELKLKEEFAEDIRERLEKGEAPEPEDENRVDFDQDFVGRFRFTLEGEEVVDEHLCWVVYLEPRDENLPVRRNIDHALNNSTGRIWVSQDDFGVARVEFEMGNSVKFWGGIIGSLRSTTGRLEFTRVAPDVWLPNAIDIKFDVRILIRSIRRRITREWNEYTPHSAAD